MKRGFLLSYCACLLFYTCGAAPAQRDSLAGYRLFMAKTALASAHPDSAINLLRSARSHFIQLQDVGGVLETDKLLADYYLENNLDSAALMLYKSILHNSGITNRDSLIAEVQAQLAILAGKNKRYAEALALDSVCIRTFSRLGARNALANAYFHTAQMQSAQKRFKTAEQILLKNCLRLYSSAGNKAGRCRTFGMLGDTYLALSKTSEAKWFYIQEQMLARLINNRKLLARSYIGLGNVKVRIGDFNLAQGDFNAALPLAAGSYALLSELSKGLGDLYHKTGKNDVALRSYAKARRYASLRDAGARRNREIARGIAMRYNRRLPAPAMKPAAATKKPDVKLPFIIFAVIFSASVTIIILFFRFRRKNKEHPERK